MISQLSLYFCSLAMSDPLFFFFFFLSKIMQMKSGRCKTNRARTYYNVNKSHLRICCEFYACPVQTLKKSIKCKKSKRVDSVSRLTAVCSFALFATKALTHEPVPSSASSCCSFTNRSDLVLFVLRTLLSFLHTVRFPPRCRIYSFQCF